MAGAGGYFADPPEGTRPAPVRVLQALLWADFALTAILVLAGLVAAGASVPVVAHLILMAWPGAVAGSVAWRLRRHRSHIVWLMAAAIWQITLAVSELLGGDPRGLTSLLLPLTIAVLLVNRPVRTYFRSPAPDPYGDTGASLIEYAGLITLAALILGTLVALSLPTQVGSNTESALCRILTSRSCGPESTRTSPNGENPNAAPNGGNPNAGNPRGDSPNTTTPSVKTCHGFFDCTWQAIRTDPHEAAKQVPCTGIVSCVVHGAAEAVSSQWNLDKAILEDGKGIVDLATNPGSLVDAGKYIWDHPGDALRKLVWDDESAKEWNHGNYVGAASRTIWNVGSWLIPGGAIGKTLSKAGKFGKLGKLADKAGELGRLARSSRAATKAADKAKQLAAKGDAKGARTAANEARRNADAAARQARKDGCAVALPLHAVPVLPHFGHYGAAALPTCAMHESEQARQARQAAEKAEQQALRSSIKTLSKSQAKNVLKKYDSEPEQFKKEIVGRAGGKFDIAKASDGKLYLVSKDGKTIVPTGYDA